MSAIFTLAPGQVLFRPFEGPPGSDASRGTCAPIPEKLSFPAGSAVFPLDQRAAKVAIRFLEPEGPDSGVSWGFFNAMFEQKECGEAYVLELEGVPLGPERQ